MKHINQSLVKRVHAKIMRFGKRLNGCHHFLGGLYAHNKGKGFSIAVSDAYNYVKLGQSNHLQYECVSADSQERFLRKVRRLDQQY
ncbi:hypothetical protein [Neptuniibacter halophilus]|uniref:hypothetical protein n=1 Tax=Neptuniibacter halophilus TaxID=651666 RepID=UPI002572FE40|nr:hypothetical protein [Neptuniibacter halophilus]